MFKKILVGVDGSETSLRAVDMASDLAKQHEAQVVFVHVVQVSAIAEQAIKASATEHLGDKPKRIMDQLSQEILEKAKERSLAKGVPDGSITTAGMDGNQARRLVQAASRRKADLLVVGSRGRGRWEGLLLGSVSQKVAALAPCPCLIVR